MWYKASGSRHWLRSGTVCESVPEKIEGLEQGADPGLCESKIRGLSTQATVLLPGLVQYGKVEAPGEKWKPAVTAEAHDKKIKK